MLLRARNQLGIDDTDAAKMHMETFTSCIKDLLGEDKKFVADASETLSKLKGVLGLGSVESEACLESQTANLYKSAVGDILSAACGESPNLSSLVGQLAVRQNELLMSGANSEAVMKSCIMRTLNEAFDEGCLFARVNNVKGGVEAMKKLINVKTCVHKLLEKMLVDNKDDDREYDVDEDSEPTLSLEETYFGGGVGVSSSPSGGSGSNVKERQRLYQYFLNDLLEQSENNLNDEGKGLLEELQGLLGVSKFEANLVSRDTCGPMIRAKLDEVVSGGDRDAKSLKKAKKAISDLAVNLQVPLDVVEDFIDLFFQFGKTTFWSVVCSS